MAGPSGKKEKVVKEKVAAGPSGKKKDVKKETGLGLSVKKDENFGEWYSEVCLYAQDYCFDILFCHKQVMTSAFFLCLSRCVNTR